MKADKAVRRVAITLSQKGRHFGSLTVAPRFIPFNGVASVDQNAQSKLRIYNVPRTLKSSFSSSASSLPDMINSKIDSNKVVIFSKSSCPFCTATKRLFASMEVEAEIVELDMVPDGYAIQNELKTMTGQRTVPNVFVGGKHVGGNDDVQAAARNGKLEEMLN